MHEPSPLFVCITTVENRADAETLATQVVEKQLAACVQIDSPITSIYRWQGNVEKEDEIRVWFFAVEATLDKLKDFVHQVHPYDTPKWVSFAAEKVSEKYLKWANEVSNLRGFI